MQANRQKLGIFLILLGLIIIFLIIYFSFIKKDKGSVIITPDDKETEIVSESAGTTTPSDITRNYQKYDISQEKEHTFNTRDLVKRAKYFAERFGSYSNQSNYENFSDLELFMTEDFASWSVSYVKQLRENAPSFQSYYGISTRALSTEVINFDDKEGKAEINILTERNESSFEGSQEPYRQNILLKFEKVNNDWLVDAAYWEKR